VVVEFRQNACSLRTEYRLISRLALSKRSGGIDGRPVLLYIPANVRDSDDNTRSAKTLMARNGWSLGTLCSGLTSENKAACFVSSPRIDDDAIRTTDRRRSRDWPFSTSC
jgi:hypothetical protein